MASERALRTGTLIIGAGQAGLAAAYHLKKRGLPFLVVDADARIGDHWRNHWDSLRLFSPSAVDGLPGMGFPAPAYHFPTGREMGDFLEAYADRFAFPVMSGTLVDSVRQSEDGGFEVVAGKQRIAADQVIVASGAFRNPRVPAVAYSLDPQIRQLHSSEYRNPSQLRDGPVLVVGLSHSGADIAFEVSNAHRTYLSGKAVGEFPIKAVDTRRSLLGWFIVRFLATRVFTLGTPIGRRMAPRVRNGGGPLLRVRSADLRDAGVIRYDAKTTGVSDGKPMLDDGQVLDVANVIWATGFRPDYGWIEVPGLVGNDGWPMGARGISPAASGLYFLGVPFQWAFASMNVFGVGRDAAHVVDRIAESARASRPERAMGTVPA
jgi:putative flavoprotein involved in K+ transport